ncbi:MAG TPA: phage baseplate assembly protein V [Casimicrobiaceae bacterium]|nr:phage baseplate assembly protein V [Casimicrobiaceae bacterium]
MELLEALAGGIAPPGASEGRLPYLVYGIITDTKDPLGLGRVKARVGSQKDNESTDWLDPAWPGSIEAVPAEREPCFVAFVTGDPHRGVYFWHPTTKTRGRAQDFMLLGTTFAGVYNDLVAKFNNLLAAFNAFVSVFNSHVHVVSGTANLTSGAVAGTAAAVTSGASTDNDANAAQIKAADGSIPPRNAATTIALSGRAKVK